MNWVCVQHVPFEEPGHVATWAAARGHALARVEAWRGAFPDDDAWDVLVVLGGPMGVHDERAHPWLVDEARFLERAVASGRPVLGVCLGAQLLARVLGARVARHAHREIGWFPVELTPAGRTVGPFAGFPDRFPAFHWHGDRFEIPDGAVHAARSDGCDTQAFVLGDRVVGVQFHLEMTAGGIAALARRCRDEVVAGPFVDAALRRPGCAAAVRGVPAANALAGRLLERLEAAALLGPRPPV